MIANSAGITIVTGKSLVGRNQFALARFSVAETRLTGRIGSLGCVARNHRPRHQLALEGYTFLVAVERAITKVAVIKRAAIGIFAAFAGNFITAALARLALVGHGTWVSVVTSRLIEFAGAPTQAVADVVGAGIVIVTGDGQSDAEARVAVVPDGASITVDTFALSQGRMLAPRLAFAEVYGARIAIIAKLHVFAVQEDRLV